MDKESKSANASSAGDEEKAHSCVGVQVTGPRFFSLSDHDNGAYSDDESRDYIQHQPSQLRIFLYFLETRVRIRLGALCIRKVGQATFLCKK